MYPSALTWHGSDRSDKAFNRLHLSGSCSLYSFWKPGTRDTYVSPEMHLRASSQGQVSGGSHVQTEGPLGQFSTHIPGLARAMDRGLVLLLHLGGGDRNGFQSTGVPWGTGVLHLEEVISLLSLGIHPPFLNAGQAVQCAGTLTGIPSISRTVLPSPTQMSP